MAEPDGGKPAVRHADRQRGGLRRKNTDVLEELVDAVLVKFRKHHPSQPVEVDIPEAFIMIPMDPS